MLSVTTAISASPLLLAALVMQNYAEVMEGVIRLLDHAHQRVRGPEANLVHPSAKLAEVAEHGIHCGANDASMRGTQMLP